MQKVSRGNLLDSGVSKRAAQKKSSNQKDVRYRMKELESASFIDDDDFFAGNFNKQISPDKFV